jgi:HAD superfamily hydrolase (TIGR01459 family)
MICTNPDLIVDRGSEREFCAGSIAKIFEELGGEVDYFGKPYPLVYKQTQIVENKKILCIGDNLNTDIKGANIQNFNSLFISNGIHKNEKKNNLNNLLESYNVKVDYVQSKLKW